MPRNEYKPREGQTEPDISHDQGTVEQGIDWDEWFGADY